MDEQTIITQQPANPQLKSRTAACFRFSEKGGEIVTQKPGLEPDFFLRFKELKKAHRIDQSHDKVHKNDPD